MFVYGAEIFLECVSNSGEDFIKINQITAWTDLVDRHLLLLLLLLPLMLNRD